MSQPSPVIQQLLPTIDKYLSNCFSIPETYIAIPDLLYYAYTNRYYNVVNLCLLSSYQYAKLNDCVIYAIKQCDVTSLGKFLNCRKITDAIDCETIYYRVFHDTMYNCHHSVISEQNYNTLLKHVQYLSCRVTSIDNLVKLHHTMLCIPSTYDEEFYVNRALRRLPQYVRKECINMIKNKWQNEGWSKLRVTYQRILKDMGYHTGSIYIAYLCTRFDSILSLNESYKRFNDIIYRLLIVAITNKSHNIFLELIDKHAALATIRKCPDLFLVAACVYNNTKVIDYLFTIFEFSHELWTQYAQKYDCKALANTLQSKRDKNQSINSSNINSSSSSSSSSESIEIVNASENNIIILE